eukprot:8924621-Pyramimonas_sp.AAC.1
MIGARTGVAWDTPQGARRSARSRRRAPSPPCEAAPPADPPAPSPSAGSPNCRHRGRLVKRRRRKWASTHTAPSPSARSPGWGGVVWSSEDAESGPQHRLQFSSGGVA